jgi:hypothetical protein
MKKIKDDPWVGVAWHIYVAEGIDGIAKPKDRAGCFTLAPILDDRSGETAYYDVLFAANDMPKCWQGVRLFPRGNCALKLPKKFRPRAPWAKKNDPSWGAAESYIVARIGPPIERLEGDIYPKKNAESVTLVRIDKATSDDKPLLVLRVKSEASILEDGTAHGDGR